MVFQSQIGMSEAALRQRGVVKLLFGAVCSNGKRLLADCKRTGFIIHNIAALYLCTAGRNGISPRVLTRLTAHVVSNRVFALKADNGSCKRFGIGITVGFGGIICRDGHQGLYSDINIRIITHGQLQSAALGRIEHNCPTRRLLTGGLIHREIIACCHGALNCTRFYTQCAQDLTQRCAFPDSKCTCVTRVGLCLAPG